MKSIKILSVGLIMMLVGFAASAQKIGCVNGEALVYSLPEIQKVQETLQKFQLDSIGGQYERIMAEYKRKDSIVKAATTPKAVKETAQKDLNDLTATLQNWQQIASQANQEKQAQLMQPLYKKVLDAITAVAKEKGYAYVLAQDAFLVVPDADNITLAVAQKLGIKIPAQTPAK